MPKTTFFASQAAAPVFCIARPSASMPKPTRTVELIIVPSEAPKPSISAWAALAASSREEWRCFRDGVLLQKGQDCFSTYKLGVTGWKDTDQGLPKRFDRAGIRLLHDSRQRREKSRKKLIVGPMIRTTTRKIVYRIVEQAF